MCCVIAHIPDSVLYWWQLYEYEQDFPGCPVPRLKDRPRRYLLARSYYLGKKSEYEMKKNGR